MSHRRVAVALASLVAAIVGLGDAARAHFLFVQVAGSGFDPITAQGTDLPFGAGILSSEVPFTRITGGPGSGPYLDQTAHPSVDLDGAIHVLAAVDSLYECGPCNAGPALTSQAQLEYYDFVVTRTDGAPSDAVPARVNFEFDASLDAWARSLGIRVAANLLVNVRGPGGMTLDSDQLKVEACTRESVDTCSFVRGDGIFSPYDVPGTDADDVLSIDVALDAQSSSFNAPVGTPFRVGFTVLAHVEVATFDSFPTQLPYGKASVDARPPSAEQGLRFARTRPVLELPEGYTVNAPSAFVVDNVFVPEPPHALGAATALAILALISARDTRTPQARAGRARHGPASARCRRSSTDR